MVRFHHHVHQYTINQMILQYNFSNPYIRCCQIIIISVYPYFILIAVDTYSFLFVKEELRYNKNLKQNSKFRNKQNVKSDTKLCNLFLSLR